MAATSLDQETVKKVIRQVEFYFSDSNLPRDKFLTKTISESEDGMVSLALICSFSRMRGHLSLGDAKAEEVPDDTVKAVAETLRKSTSLKISEDGTKVGRTTELMKLAEVIEQLDNRTIAASPLEYDVKLEDVESFFGEIAKVNSVRLPRHVADKRLFCGTALVEFSSEEDADKVLKQSLVYAGAELELNPKKEFDADRVKQAEEVENSSHRVGENRKDNSSPKENYPKGLIIAFTLKSMSAGGSAEQKDGHEVIKENMDVCKEDGERDSMEDAEEKVSECVNGNEEIPRENIEEVSEEKVDEKSSLESEGKETDAGENPDSSSEKVSEEKVDEKSSLEGEGMETDAGENPDSSIEKVSEEKIDEKNSLESEGKETDAGENPDSSIEKDNDKAAGEGKPTAASYRDNKEVVMREDLKAVFQKYGTVKFVDFKIGENSGYIRFDEPEAAQKARAAGALSEEGGLVVKNFVATLDPVSGEAEREYWSQIRGNQERHRESIGNRGRGGKHNRGRRQFHGKHSRSRDGDSANRPSKVQKVGAA